MLSVLQFPSVSFAGKKCGYINKCNFGNRRGQSGSGNENVFFFQQHFLKTRNTFIFTFRLFSIVKLCTFFGSAKRRLLTMIFFQKMFSKMDFKIVLQTCVYVSFLFIPVLKKQKAVFIFAAKQPNRFLFLPFSFSASTAFCLTNSSGYQLQYNVLLVLAVLTLDVEKQRYSHFNVCHWLKAASITYSLHMNIYECLVPV